MTGAVHMYIVYVWYFYRYMYSKLAIGGFKVGSACRLAVTIWYPLLTIGSTISHRLVVF